MSGKTGQLQLPPSLVRARPHHFGQLRKVAGALKTPCWFPHVMPTTQIFQIFKKYFQYILRYFKYIREVAGALKTPCWFLHVMPTTQIFTEWEL